MITSLYWLSSSSSSPGCCWPPLLPERAGGSCLACDLKTHGSLSSRAAPQPGSPQTVWQPESLPSQGQDFVLFQFHAVPVDPFLSRSRSCWMAALALKGITWSPNLASAANMTGVHAGTSPPSLRDTLNRTCPRTDASSGLHLEFDPLSTTLQAPSSNQLLAPLVVHPCDIPGWILEYWGRGEIISLA